MLICMQKINFTSNLFSEILSRHCELAILETLEMLDHPQQKIVVSFVENFHAYLYAKNQHLLLFFRYCKK